MIVQYDGHTYTVREYRRGYPDTCEYFVGGGFVEICSESDDGLVFITAHKKDGLLFAEQLSQHWAKTRPSYAEARRRKSRTSAP